MEEWKKRVKFATDLAIKEQERFEERYCLGKYENYTFDLNTGQIVFTKDNEILTLSAQVVGSIYHAEENVSLWVWSWDDEFVSEEAKKEMEKMKSFGDDLDFLAIKNSFWEAGELDALQMASVSLNIIDGQSIFCCKIPSNDYYFVIKSANLETKTKRKIKHRM